MISTFVSHAIDKELLFLFELLFYYYYSIILLIIQLFLFVCGHAREGRYSDPNLLSDRRHQSMH